MPVSTEAPAWPPGWTFRPAQPVRDGLGLPIGANPARFRLVHAYDRDARKWVQWRWLNVYDGQRYGITTRGETGRGSMARVSTYRDVLTEYRVHPERKSTDASGEPCMRATVGLLGRRSVCVAHVTVIGKEANRLEDVTAGVVGAWDEVLTVYDDGTEAFWRAAILPRLRAIKAAVLAEAAGISLRTIKAIRNGYSMPRVTVRARLLQEVTAIHKENDKENGTRLITKRSRQTMEREC